MTNGRKACRDGQRCEPRTLAEAIYCVVHHSDVDVDRIVEHLGVRRGYLIDATNPDRDDTHFQVRWIVPVTAITGNAAIVEYLARTLGGVFVQLPPLTPGRHDDIVTQAAKAMGEVGDVFTEMRRALADDTLTPKEAQRFSVEIEQAIAMLLSLGTIFNQKAGVTPAPGA